MSLLRSEGDMEMNNSEIVIRELSSALEWVSDEDNSNGSIAVKIWAVRDALKLIISQQEKIRELESHVNKIVAALEILRIAEENKNEQNSCDC